MACVPVVLSILPPPMGRVGVGASLLFKFYIFQFLFLATVAALECVSTLEVEYRLHRLVVGDADRVCTLHDVRECLRESNLSLSHNLIVANLYETYVRAYNGKLADFSLCEELTAYLDKSLLAHHLALKVVADKYWLCTLAHLKKLGDGEELVCWYVVDDCSVLKSSHEFLFFVTHKKSPWPSELKVEN